MANIIDDIECIDVVNAQLGHYNKRDLEKFCALFSLDAEIDIRGPNPARIVGMKKILGYYEERFKSQDLHCVVVSRAVRNQFVIDVELVIGIGSSPAELVAVYQVENSLIKKLSITWLV